MYIIPIYFNGTRSGLRTLHFFVWVMVQNKLKHVQRSECCRSFIMYYSSPTAGCCFWLFLLQLIPKGRFHRQSFASLRLHSQILAGNCTFHPNINSINRNPLPLKHIQFSRPLSVFLGRNSVRKIVISGPFFGESVSKGCWMPILTLGILKNRKENVPKLSLFHCL